jgi:acyl dehydratase
MTTVKFNSVRDLQNRVGEEISISDWLTVTQERIDQFAKAIDDYQWIHVDVEKAKRELPYKNTIAHGFLTMSLLSRFLYEAMEFGPARMGLNYGMNRLRFVSPVPTGSRLRARFKLKKYEAVDDEGVQMTWDVTVELEGQAKPALVAEWLTRRYE